LIKQQWGTNLKKYGGIQLPGGTTLQGQEMYSEAKEEILQLTEELHTMWQDPPSFFVGHIGG
jgi:surfactin synthase thioesterase subunit